MDFRVDGARSSEMSISFHLSAVEIVKSDVKIGIIFIFFYWGLSAFLLPDFREDLFYVKFFNLFGFIGVGYQTAGY